MLISAIKQQVRQQSRYSVYVDGKYGFSLSDTALLDSRLVPGQELSGEEIKRFKQLSIDDKAQGNALRYAMIRPRSYWEMEQYLKRKQVDFEFADQILNKLSDLNMLDDLAFAQSWVENRRLLKPISQRKLQQELRAKKISDDIIRQVLQADETDERAVLRQMAERKRRQSQYHDPNKLMQYLARQGFSYDDIKAVMGELAAEGNTDG